MGIVFYDVTASPPCRAVKLTLNILGLDYQLHTVDFMNKEHLSSDYVKMNPQHTVPMIVDNGFAVYDSHAINSYLVTKYGKDDKLYPKDPNKRSVVDQRMYFECGVLFVNLRNIVVKIRGGQKVISEEDITKVHEAYDFVEKFLSSGTKYIAGDEVTIADFSVANTLCQLDVIVPFLKSQKYPLTEAYVDHCNKTITGFQELNEAGLAQMKQLLKMFGYVLGNN